MSTTGNSFLTRTARALACLCLFVLPALASDITPPTLGAFTFAPTSINTTSNSATVTATAQASDDLSGVAFIDVFFTSPSGLQNVAGGLGLICGTGSSGCYQGLVSFPAFGEAGTWTVSELELGDNVGNRSYYSTAQLQALGFPTTLQVTSQQDTMPPTLGAFTFAPTSINTTSNSATVTVTAQASDDLSGVAFIDVFFTSPSGLQNVAGGLGLISGTGLSGTYQGSVSFPAFGEAGTWTVSELELGDNVGNRSYYSTAQLQALGFPTTLQVTSQQDTMPPTLGAFTFAPTSINTTSNSATVTVTAQASDDLSGVAFIDVFFTSPSGLQNVAGGLGLISGT